MKIVKAKKRPVEVEAVLWDGSYEYGCKIEAWSAGAVQLKLTARAGDEEGYPGYRYTLSIATLEGIMQVSPGDWIIHGWKGEFYAIKPDIFEATYEIL